MFNADVLTFREFVMHEMLPLSKIQEAVLKFLQGRNDVVLFDAQAVNAYVDEPRMTQDVDLLSSRAPDLAEELRAYIAGEFHIAVRARKVGEKGFRLYQIREEGNRHLVDIRSVETLPPSKSIENILVLSPVELVASKIISYHSRKGKPKAGTDWRDLAELLLRFPELKKEDGEVGEILANYKVGENVLDAWREIVGQHLQTEDDDDLIF
jgi:hypothetical protein